MDLKVNNFQERLNIPKAEEEVLSFWDETKAFETSVSSRPEDKRYVFYDGPPFATGLPHYGHILASTIKDVVPRYWTMKGYRVDRVWGWDCHGIPIENMIEKELGLKGGKKGIEELGIDKFNAACRAAILRFDKDWEVIMKRVGRWVDFKRSYKTMDATFMESVWWVFKQLNDKGLVYEGKRVILYCPRCATPLSNFEIAMDNSYKDVEDNSVYVKFAIKGKKNEYLVAWTTTPWTLIGNVALAVDENAEYAQVSLKDETYWVAVSRKEAVFGPEGLVKKTSKGKELVGIEYEPLYGYMPLDGKRAHYVAAADFVSMEDGTGIVHTAAIFGEDDYKLAVKLDLPRVATLDDQGKFLDFVEPLKGMFYKKSEAWVIEDLTTRHLMLRAEKITHSYPFCYRCETPLYYNAVPAWFIDVQKIKPDLISENEKINWYPDHLKHGRFGKGLEGAPDWNISRSRYWGTPMPVWVESGVKDKPKTRIVGSVDELKQWAVDPKQVENLTDIHREFLDDIEVWVDDEKSVKGKRIPEVFDCWVESGSMPYASIHYPFENKVLFEKTHPAQFIAEYIAQTRAWFYTLHVMSVGLFGTHTFENAVTTGTILAEDGNKMSKSKKNYPDPALIFEKYGVDALRFYLMESVVMKAENLNFSEAQVGEIYQSVFSTLWNVFSFYKLHVTGSVRALAPAAVHVMDKWIISKVQKLTREVTLSMDGYDTSTTCRLLREFISDFSTWYLRRSRGRMRADTLGQEVFGFVLSRVTLLLAPIAPFLSERIWQNLTGGGKSVHLESWPEADESQIDESLEEHMRLVRVAVAAGLAKRKEMNVAVKQPMETVAFEAVGDFTQIPSDVWDVALEELNVFNIQIGEFAYPKEKVVVGEERLKQLGEVRSLVRSIQALRKEKGCQVDDTILVELPESYKNLPPDLLDYVKAETLTSTISWGSTLQVSIG
jgi:isoleucyl-tRNA synthetase